MMKRFARPAALVAAAALTLSGCSAGGGGDGDGAEPIRLGAVSTLSGAATFPEAAEAAAAVFDRVNAEGGIDGRPIAYRALDDKSDPATATTVARELVSGDGVVALVGSASLLDCEVNAAYYEAEGVRAIQGTGVDAACFGSPNIAPVNIGPFHDTTLTMLYGSEGLGLTSLCVLTSVSGSTAPAYRAAIDRWSAITGKTPTHIDDTLPYGAPDFTPYVVRAREAGCDGIVSNAVEPDGIGQIKAANQQGWDDVTFLFLTSVYSESFASAVDNSGAGVFVPAEFYPFTEDSPVNAEWKSLMEQEGITLTSFSQGGYLAATILVEVLRGIEGEITRESVNAALAEMEPITNPMIAFPYQFDRVAAQEHTPGGWPVVLRPGTREWERAGEDWLRFPAS